eukprot:3306677-Amphidinium_carterae.2
MSRSNSKVFGTCLRTHRRTDADAQHSEKVDVLPLAPSSVDGAPADVPAARKSTASPLPFSPEQGHWQHIHGFLTKATQDFVRAASIQEAGLQSGTQMLNAMRLLKR